MRISLIITDFESSYLTSFKHTARKKYGVDFNTSNVDDLGLKLAELKDKVENNQSFDVHVGFEITLEHVVHVQDLLNKILENYLEVFGKLPINRKIYTINQKLREVNSPSTVDLAKQVLSEILQPKPDKLTRAERINKDAEAESKMRALKLIQKRSDKNK